MLTTSDIYLGEFEVFLFASPEDRCLQGLDSLTKIGQLKRAWIAEFVDYDKTQPDDLHIDDKNTINSYHKNLSKLKERLNSLTSDIQPRKYRLNLLESFDYSLGPPTAFNSPIVVDISCAPRGHLLGLLDYLARCQITSYHQIILMYSLVERQSILEDNYSYGMQDIAVIPGHNGQIRLRQDLLVMALGFEGNRAFSLYRRISPSKTFLILGDTKDEKDKQFYLDRAKKNNYSLLSIPGMEVRTMSSRDPFSFSKEFGKFLNEEISPLADKYNIYFSCLGTKLQTVGAFLALQSHPNIQVLDGLPTRRRISSIAGSKTVFADFGCNELIDPSIIE